MWSTLIICVLAVISVNGYSKYGRTCKDIGCLSREVCVLAEDPCSLGRTSDCGSYPTCVKKTAADGGGDNQNVPVIKPTTPKPIAELKPQPAPPKYDDTPNYPPPPPPRNPYGGSSNGGYGSNTGGGGYGSNNGGYGSNSGGGGFGSNSGGTGGFGGFSNPFSGFNFGGSSNGDKNSNPITNILSGLLSNFTKGIPSLNPGLTRPGLIDNRNPNNNPYNPSYPSNPSNGQAYPGYNNPYQRPGGFYPSFSQPNQGQPTQQNGYIAKNYGQNNAQRSAATTIKPSYGWVFKGFTIFSVAIISLLTNKIL